MALCKGLVIIYGYTGLGRENSNQTTSYFVHLTYGANVYFKRGVYRAISQCKVGFQWGQRLV